MPRRQSTKTGRFEAVTAGDLFNIDLDTLSGKDLRKFVSQIDKMANMRMTRLGRMTNPPPSYYRTQAERGGKNWTIRGKSDAALRTQAAQIKDFMRSGTSTVASAKDFWQKMGDIYTPAEMREMREEWETDPSSLQEFGEYKDSLGSPEILAIVNEAKTHGLTGDAWKAFSARRAKEIYEASKEADYEKGKESGGTGEAGGQPRSGARFSISDLDEEDDQLRLW